MRKRSILVLMLCCSMAVVCGNSTETNAGSIDESEAGEQAAYTDTESLSATDTISEWKIPLPGGDRKAEYSQFMESWELYKDNYYDGLDSTMSIYVNTMNAEESRLASENLTSSMLNVEIREFDYEVNNVICPAYEQYSEKFDATMVKVFYPLSSQESLQIKIFVKKGNRQSFDPDSGEVKQIIKDIVEENGRNSGSLSGEESADSSLFIHRSG